MKLIGILCWYDEAPSWLAASVTGMIHHTQIDHLVAVDGAYALLPGGRASSGFEQHQIIDEVCRANEVGLTMHVPAEPWFGNEIEKRSFAFRLAETVAEVGEDWYLVLDADEVVNSAFGVKDMLAETTADAGEIALYERFDPTLTSATEAVAREIDVPRESGCMSRRFFRALPRLHCVDNHFTYITDGGHVLWKGGTGGSGESIQLHVEVEHRTRLRDVARRRQQAVYYERRDELGLERTYEAVA